MALPTIRIRQVGERDQKLARFLVGKSNMECLAVANSRAYIYPTTLALWVALSCMFVELMHWWPKPEYGMLGYLSPIPAFVSMSVPIMFLCDWFNRSVFEDRTNHILRRPDLVDIPKYYSRSPASGFWFLEYADNPIGLIAIDASLDSMSDKAVQPKQGYIQYEKGTSSTATIRHFFVEEQYRKASIQQDLVEHAVDHAFAADKAVQKIRVHDTPLKDYITKVLKELGFRLEEKTERVGILRWQDCIRSLDRAHRKPSSEKR
ncbi:hypothetical protein OBBRIDRAFT_787017 [Obba rivulosa]|uniref:N-acetyltransferase domain-containing protein n=1 Tax=Obba rivulosa TaxID=1052685 RepID=A0A8E2J7E0_9APHY|nr:hypothetical protein OBBRIDRAFT_787017 [Obba rivulosa]